MFHQALLRASYRSSTSLLFSVLDFWPVRQLRIGRGPAALWLIAVAISASVSLAAEDPSAQPPKGAPEYQAPPRPGDGAHMALTVQKLEKGFDPQRPLLIWAIGSSFTNGLGNGDLLIELIRQRFPNAPPIVYKRIAGNSTLVSLLSRLGTASGDSRPAGRGADLQLRQDRRPGSHDRRIAPADDGRYPRRQPALVRAAQARVARPGSPQQPSGARRPAGHVREVRRRVRGEPPRDDRVHARHTDLAIEDLLADAVHENRYASKMTVMNIARHFHRAEQFRYDPESRQRRVEVETPVMVKMAPGQWTPAEGDTARTATAPGSSLCVPFTGNRVELIGWRGPDGGTADVWIDGQPASESDAFYVGYIQPDKQNAPLPPNPPRDRCPHAVSLGQNVVPQAWTMTMTSDMGDYELVGSVTGPDGKGNGLKPFTSTSGQIIVDPDFWRDAKNNRSGDRFTFEVCAGDAGVALSSRPRPKSDFGLRLADYLPNRPHVLKLVARGDGAVTVDAFEVFEPPWK